MDGLILLNKPAGLSSARAVSRVKRMLPRGGKIGHAGTLDPFATGLLILLVGKATRCCEELMSQPKRYEATVQLGATSETDDPDSLVRPVAGAADPGRESIETALRKFIGEISQQPPMYCALKVGGRRAYQLAREGQTPAIRPRMVRIDSIEVLEYAWPRLRLRIDCGRGTYIRAIARDLGAELGVGGLLAELSRTAIGPHRLETAATLEQLAAEGIERHLRPAGAMGK